MADFIPYSREFLRSCAHEDCPCCKGGGVAHGFGLYGRLCPCVHTCEFCMAPLPGDDDHFDEGYPIKYDGMPTCKVCRDKFAAEDAAELIPAASGL